MRNLGFIFAGQGQQFPYMGQDFYEMDPTLYDIANDILGDDVVNMDLDTTENTQIALFVLEAIIDTHLKKYATPKMVCGLSLGEYGALFSSGVISFEAGVKMIQKRGSLMGNAFKPGETAMAACLKTDRETIETLIANLPVEICNVNTPTQVVIGGLKADVDEAILYLKRNKVRALPLKVPTVSHMSLLKNETDLLNQYLKTVHFNKPMIPFINNIEARFQEDNFPDTLSRQISEKTELYESIKLMIHSGITDIVEVGPKGTITKFIKEIDPSIQVINVYDVQTLEEFKQWINP